MSVRTLAISSSTKFVDRMATLISTFAFLKRHDVSPIHRFKKFVMVHVALILIAVRLTSHPRINIQTIACSGITNADILWLVNSTNLLSGETVCPKSESGRMSVSGQPK